MLADKDLVSIQETRSKVEKAYAAWQKYRAVRFIRTGHALADHAPVEAETTHDARPIVLDQDVGAVGEAVRGRHRVG